MLRALLHLHNLSIAHSDIRIDNFLCASDSRILLCDFSCARHFGQPNPSTTKVDEPLGVNGAAETVSDATDRFALASVLYFMEVGDRPHLLLMDGNVKLPHFTTGHNGIDSMITKAWLGKYNSTAHMLQDTESFRQTERKITSSDSISFENLEDRVKQWRNDRQDRFGTTPNDRLNCGGLITRHSRLYPGGFTNQRANRNLPSSVSGLKNMATPNLRR
jgi:serine/threonine protein kinase